MTFQQFSEGMFWILLSISTILDFIGLCTMDSERRQRVFMAAHNLLLVAIAQGIMSILEAVR
jgi:hypothetical protein